MKKEKMILLYIPGYGSNGNSHTFQSMKDNIPECKVECLEYDNINPDNAKKQLKSQIDHYLTQNNELILIGSSLGGYWTNYFAQKYKTPCFLINPSLFPKTNLKKYKIDEKYLKKYADSTFKLVSRTIFLGKNDDVVDNKKTEEIFKSKADITWLNEGHRLDDYGPVIKKIKYFINNAQEV